MDPEKVYNQLKFYHKKANSFLFRNTAGRLLPDSLDEISSYTSTSEQSIRKAYRQRFVDDEFNEDETVQYLELKQQVDNSQLIELRSDPLENPENAFEELERVACHLEGVSSRAREKYSGLADNIEKEFREYIRNHEEISEEYVEWNSTVSFS